MKTIYVVLSGIILLLMVRLLSSDGGISDYISLQAKIGQMDTQIHELEDRNATLRKEVYGLQTSNKAIETIARQKLGMIGKDEVFVKVIEINSTPSSSTAPITSSTPVLPEAPSQKSNSSTTK